ncbi:MAG: hypothetical protein WBC93_00905 [Sulfitobacter sp.]
MPNERPIIAALSALILLQLVMLSALYAGITPHPPVATPLFGMAPFLAASFAVAFSAILLGPLSGKAGRVLSGLAVVLALVSFGPQKYFDAQFALIWPAVIAGQIAAITVLVEIFKPACAPQLAAQ